MKTRLFHGNGPLRHKMGDDVQDTLKEIMITCGANDSEGTDDDAAGSSDVTRDSVMVVADLTLAFHVCVAGGEYQNAGLQVQERSKISLTQIGNPRVPSSPPPS